MAKTITPKVIKINKKETAKESTRKKTTVIHRTEKPVQDIIQLLGEIERTIRELTILLAEASPSKHMGVRGLPKLTTKQIEIKKQIQAAQRRYHAVLKLLMQK